MVKVQEVHDSPYSSSASTHSRSSDSLASSISDDNEIQKESLVDRLVALVDIVPPQTRHSITTRVSNFVGAVKTGGKVVGNVVWVLTTSALLIGLPLALALEDEAKIVQQEKEMAAQQQGVQQVRLHSFFSALSADVASPLRRWLTQEQASTLNSRPLAREKRALYPPVSSLFTSYTPPPVVSLLHSQLISRAVCSYIYTYEPERFSFRLYTVRFTH